MVFDHFRKDKKMILHKVRTFKVIAQSDNTWFTVESHSFIDAALKWAKNYDALSNNMPIATSGELCEVTVVDTESNEEKKCIVHGQMQPMYNFYGFKV